MTSLKSDVVQLSAQVQHHDQRMSEFERQLKDNPPKIQRTVVVGGFAYGTEGKFERDIRTRTPGQAAKVSLKRAETEQLYQVKRMIGGIGDMLFSICSQTENVYDPRVLSGAT